MGDQNELERLCRILRETPPSLWSEDGGCLRTIKDDLAFTLKPAVKLGVPQVRLEIAHADTGGAIDSYLSTGEQHPLAEIYLRVSRELASRPTSVKNLDETRRLD